MRVYSSPWPVAPIKINNQKLSGDGDTRADAPLLEVVDAAEADQADDVAVERLPSTPVP
jgi:hypothetical protein